MARQFRTQTKRSTNGGRVAKLISRCSGFAANTLAWWLVKGGFDVTVVEREPHFVCGGQSVDVRGAGSEVMNRMGLKEEVERSGTGETAWTFVDDDGEQVAAFTVEDLGPDGPTAKLEILRGDLADVVYQNVRERVDYRFSDTISAIEDGAESVRVSFQSGREETFDLVLVAEGVGSSTRELLFRGENHPRWMDMTIACFTIPRETSDSTEARWYNAPGGRVVFLRPDPHGDTRTVLMVQHEARSSKHKSAEEAKAWLKEVFRGRDGRRRECSQDWRKRTISISKSCGKSSWTGGPTAALL